MTRAELLDLIAYSDWATDRLAESVRTMPDDRRRLRDDSAFGSLLGTFAHLVGAEWVWLQRWQGTSVTAPPAWTGEANFDQLVERLRDIQSERRELLGALDDAELLRPLAYRTFAGTAHENTIGDLVRHVVNHGTYHRGQLSMRIRQLGHQPPSTDYIAWLRLDARPHSPTS